MKEIHMVPMYYVFLKFLWKHYFVFVRYQINRIPASEIVFKFCNFQLGFYASILLLIMVDSCKFK